CAEGQLGVATPSRTLHNSTADIAERKAPVKARLFAFAWHFKDATCLLPFFVCALIAVGGSRKAKGISNGTQKMLLYAGSKVVNDWPLKRDATAAGFCFHLTKLSQTLT
ncbi:hypothetical protein M514_04201, partial [Trichuris suis]